MVQLVPNKGLYPSIESALTLTEGQLAKIKANKEKFMNVCKDLNIAHTYYEDENGNIVSRIGCTIRKVCDAMMVSIEMHEKHCKLIDVVDSWEDEAKSTKEETIKKDTELPNIYVEFFLVYKIGDSYMICGKMHPVIVINILHKIIDAICQH